MGPSSLAPRLRRLLWSTRARRVLTIVAALVAVALAVRALRRPEVPAYAAARRLLVQTVVASGRVMPEARVQLASLALGRVVAVEVDEGDRVRAGQLLVKLDDADARAALAQARARADEAAARVDQVRSVGARTAVQALRAAEARARQAERELDRARRLLDAGSVSAAEVDAATEALAVAESGQQSAAAQVASTAAAGADLRLAAAAVAQARAAEALAARALAETELRAPAAGRIIKRSVEPGDVVAAGAPLLVLARDGETLLTVEPDEKNLAVLALGQKARAAADAFPDRPFEAEVSFIAPAVDPARGTVEVRLRVPSPPPFLRPDLTVSVNVEVARKADALVVPAQVVRDAATAPWVLAVRDGRTERRAVRLGARGQGVVEVVDGLAAGDAVVAPGAAAEGARVRVRLLRDEGAPAPEPARAL